MGRWTQYDEDDYRLPAGFKRVAYDADTGQYTYRDAGGSEWNGAPYQTYGTLRPAGTTRIYQADTRRLSSISLDGPWTSVTKEMAESFDELTPESNIMYPPPTHRRRSSFVETAKSMAKRTLRSLSVSAADGTGKGSSEQEENEKLVLRARTLYDLPPLSLVPPAVPPKDQQHPSVTRTHHHRSVTFPTVPATSASVSAQQQQHQRSQSHSHSQHQHSNHSKSGSGSGSGGPTGSKTDAGKPSHSRGEREREHGSTAKPTGTPSSLDPAGHGRRKESKKQSEKEGRRWKDQRGEWEKDKDKGIEKATTRIKDVNSGRKASSSSRTAEKTPIYTRFNTVEKRR